MSPFQAIWTIWTISFNVIAETKHILIRVTSTQSSRIFFSAFSNFVLPLSRLFLVSPSHVILSHSQFVFICIYILPSLPFFSSICAWFQFPGARAPYCCCKLLISLPCTTTKNRRFWHFNKLDGDERRKNQSCRVKFRIQRMNVWPLISVLNINNFLQEFLKFRNLWWWINNVSTSEGSVKVSSCATIFVVAQLVTTVVFVTASAMYRRKKGRRWRKCPDMVPRFLLPYFTSQLWLSSAAAELGLSGAAESV